MKQGSIINISSIYGLVGPDFSIYPGSKYAGKPMGVPAAYAASKGGVIALTKYFASLFAPKIRVNCVTPGGIFDNQPDDFVKKYNLNEDIKPLVVDQFSRDGVLQGAKVYHIEETMPDDGSRELVKFIGNNVNDKSYFSVDYHTGNYFSWDFFKIKNFGKNLYIYAE